MLYLSIEIACQPDDQTIGTLTVIQPNVRASKHSAIGSRVATAVVAHE